MYVQCTHKADSDSDVLKQEITHNLVIGCTCYVTLVHV